MLPLLRKLRRLTHHRRNEAELQEELQFHLDEEAADQAASGLSAVRRATFKLSASSPTRCMEVCWIRHSRPPGRPQSFFCLSLRRRWSLSPVPPTS